MDVIVLSIVSLSRTGPWRPLCCCDPLWSSDNTPQRDLQWPTATLSQKPGMTSLIWSDRTSPLVSTLVCVSLTAPYHTAFNPPHFMPEGSVCCKVFSQYIQQPAEKLRRVKRIIWTSEWQNHMNFIHPSICAHIHVFQFFLNSFFLFTVLVIAA